MGEPITIESGGLRLAGYLARPSASAAKGASRFGLIVAHPFPEDEGGAAVVGLTYPDLADKLSVDAGWVVLTFNFRGTGKSEGDFSLGGWLKDLNATVDYLLSAGVVEGVWLCGFDVGGALSLCATGESERLRGVASFGAPADFDSWSSDPRRLLAQARRVGVIRSAGFPPDMEEWSRELREIRPLHLVGKIPPRPLLIVHGVNDDVVPMLDARALADAAENVELRILVSAGHKLRDDPRAIAVLLGWLDRQSL